MVVIRSGLSRHLQKSEYKIPIDDFKLKGRRINIFNFPELIKEYLTPVKSSNNTSVQRLNNKSLDSLTQDETLDIQWRLLKNQIAFSYTTTPGIHYLWKDIYKISPNDINSWEDWRNVPPITKEQQRMIGWINFVPSPIADFYINGATRETINNVDPNLRIKKRKYTGGTSVSTGEDYIMILIPTADWRGSVDTMERIALPIQNKIESAGILTSPYIRIHIAEEIFEDQIGRYGQHIMSKPAGANDENWLWQVADINSQGAIAPPQDHPLKGAGIPSMVYKLDNNYQAALMSSMVPLIETLATMLQKGMGILNVGGDTGSLPTYFSVGDASQYATIQEGINDLTTLNVIQMGPSLTEIINPSNLTYTQAGNEGIILQTNYSSVWKDEKTGECYIAPAMKTQMIKSSATGNLVYVIATDKFGRATQFDHQILRYNDFNLDKNLKPIYEAPMCSGGSSKGGCAG